MAKNKQLISADGTPYTPWQKRTHYLCLALIVWSLVEIGTGIGILAFIKTEAINPGLLVSDLVFGLGTVLSGVATLIVAIFGVVGAHNPKHCTVFFWGAIISAVMLSWQVASNWSVGIIDPYTIASFLISFVYALCAWNVRGQTGYFDHHPHPQAQSHPEEEE